MARTHRARQIAATLACITAGLAGAPASAATEEPPAVTESGISPYAIVDCLLPAQMRRIGERAMQILPSRPAKLSARRCAQQGGAQVEGIRAWQTLADGGDTMAQVYLGEMYENGIGGAPKDPARAKALYERAAKAGNARAASNLALLLASDAPGMPADPEKAQQAVRQAAANLGLRNIVVEPVAQSRQAATDAASRPIDLQTFPFGRYHALLIGNSDYRHAPKLPSPVHEVDAIGEMLKSRYGFNIVTLKNATGEQIMRALDDLEQSLGESDNLLVYYTGHGAESRTKEGYWIPIDGEGPNSTDGFRTARWVSSATVREKLALMKPRHILVVSDSCYSARFLQFKGVFKPPDNTAAAAYLENFARFYAARSRTALTSGGLAPVVDAVDGSRLSLFAKAFLRLLENNREPLPSAQVFAGIGLDVFDATSRIGFPQQPQWGPITGAGHESGDFWFRPKRAPSP